MPRPPVTSPGRSISACFTASRGRPVRNRQPRSALLSAPTVIGTLACSAAASRYIAAASPSFSSSSSSRMSSSALPERMQPRSSATSIVASSCRTVLNGTLDVGDKHRFKCGQRTEHRRDRCPGEPIELWCVAPYRPLPFIAPKWALAYRAASVSAHDVFPNGARADWHPIDLAAGIGCRNMW